MRKLDIATLCSSNNNMYNITYLDKCALVMDFKAWKIQHPLCYFFGWFKSFASFGTSLTQIVRGLWFCLSAGGGTLCLHLLEHQESLKNPFFDFLKVHNRLGKVNKFKAFHPIFHLKTVGTLCSPPLHY